MPVSPVRVIVLPFTVAGPSRTVNVIGKPEVQVADIANGWLNISWSGISVKSMN